MRLLVTSEFRYQRAHNGQIYSEGMYDRSFFDRYLSVFTHVTVLARVEQAEHLTPPAGSRLVEDDRLQVRALPGYVGARQLVAAAPTVRRLAREAVDECDAILMRAPGFVSTMVRQAARGRPYAVEVVGDPQEVFSDGASDHPLRAIFRVLAVRSMRKLCREACAVAYVSSLVLPQRYPASTAAHTAIYSSVTLPRTAYRDPSDADKPVRDWITVASLEQAYKGVDVLLEAMAELPSDTTLTVIGEGRLRPDLERHAQRLGLDSTVRFLGQLGDQDAVREALRSADGFVLASRTEGLPRAMLEAMALSLPCVGTRVGGIPELLPDHALCPPDSPQDLAARMRAVMVDPRHAQALAVKGHEKAGDYGLEILTDRRIRLLGQLRDATLNARSGHV